MKLRDLEFTESLGQSQIIGGTDENKVYIDLEGYPNTDISAEFREPLVVYYANKNDAISVKWHVPVIIIDNIDDVDDINTIDFTIL